MAVLRKSTAVNAGVVVPNQIEGSPFEILARPNVIQIAMVSDQPDVIAQISFGGRIIGDEIAIPLEPGAGQGPNINENLIIQETGAATERVVIRLTGGAANAVVRTLVNFSPL